MKYQELQNDGYKIVKRATFDVQGFYEGDAIKVFPKVIRSRFSFIIIVNLLNTLRETNLKTNFKLTLLKLNYCFFSEMKTLKNNKEEK